MPESITKKIVELGRAAGISTQEALRLAQSRDAITLRDYFAAHAVTGLLSAGETPDRAARKAYDVAEAMLRNREV